MNLAFVVAIAALAIANTLDALMTIAEARGKAKLAGILAAGDNTFGIIVGVIGADTFINHGLRQTLVFLAVIFVTTYITTFLATSWASKKFGVAKETFRRKRKVL